MGDTSNLQTTTSGLVRYVALKAWVSCEIKVALFKRRCITMVTYAVNQTWSGAGYQLSLSGYIGLRSFLVPPLTMLSPFVSVPMDLRVCIIQGSLQRKGVFRDRSDPLALPENILYERYSFSSEGIRHLIVLVGPYVGNATQRSCALTVAQCLCVSM